MKALLSCLVSILGTKFESSPKPLLHTRGISRARSIDLEVTPWALGAEPTYLLYLAYRS